ncbi:MAG: hypothetical protein M3160_02080 [Candidatus Eremiobacteraeota bacterium]|nr:hypothetical protein [Candidatus Eremiobacteraeota bacterium]
MNQQRLDDDDELLDLMIFQSVFGHRHHAGCAALVGGIVLLTLLFTLIIIVK